MENIKARRAHPGYARIAMALLATAGAVPVLAENASAQDNTDRQDIIVTAQKREQVLRDVPIAVSAFDEDYLANRAVNSVDRLDGIAPGLQVLQTPSQPNNAQISIRGSVQQNPAITLDPSVGMYLDGVYIGKAVGSIFAINDLERVEVLRGPQGTLYGRNTLAGAINFITRKPGPDFRASLEAGYGNYDAMTLKGMVNLPAADNLFFKVSLALDKRDGTVKLIDDPYGMAELFGSSAKSGRLNSRNRKSALVQARFEPADNVTVDYAFDYSRSVQTVAATQLISVDDAGFLGKDCALGPFCVPAYLYVQDKYSNKAFNNVRSMDKVVTQGHGLTIDWDLGDASLKSITGYRRLRFNAYPNDIDGTPLDLAIVGYRTKYWEISQEFQLSGKIGSRLNYVAGLFYFHDDAFSVNPQSYFFGSEDYYTTFGGKTTAYAAYAQIDYDITDQLTLTAGLRYNREKKTTQRYQEAIASAAFPPELLPYVVVNVPEDLGISHVFKSVNPTAILTYNLGERANIYAKFAQGFRSGGFNGEAQSFIHAVTPFRPEKMNSFEIGLKSSLFDRKLDLNIAAFLNKHKDMQLSVFTASSIGTSLIQNAGSATMKGIEVEAFARPLPSLSLKGSLAYLKARYNHFIDTNNLGQAIDVADIRVVPHAPKWQASFSADWTAYEGGDGNHLNVLVDVRHVSSYYFYADATEMRPDFPSWHRASTSRTEPMTFVDAQLRWDDIPLASGKAYAALWAKNLFNTRKVINGIDFGAAFGGLLTGNYNDPRTYGLTVGMKW